jgi:RNA polymerase sigma-70 factor (ECF subfamily)
LRPALAKWAGIDSWTGQETVSVTESNNEQTSDEQLVRQFLDGERESFSLLVRRHQERIMRVCLRLLLSTADAQDACQEVFIKTAERLHMYQPSAQFSTWLYRIAVNHCLNVLRSRRRRRWLSPFSKEPATLLDIAATEDDPLQNTEKQERQQQVRLALAALPEEQRLAVVLHRYEGLSYEEIAQVLQVSVSAVESRLHRAKKNLLQLLEPYMQE